MMFCCSVAQLQLPAVVVIVTKDLVMADDRLCVVAEMQKKLVEIKIIRYIRALI